MEDLLLGVDGGNSKTRALLADRSGNVIGVGTAGSSNQHSVGFERATESIRVAIAEAFRQAGIDPARTVAAAGFGLAGMDRPSDAARYEAWIVRQGFARRHTIVNDAELVLAAGTADGWGVSVICGTGSNCYGRAADGRTARAGGWGYLLGDEGSGYDIAVQALRLATQTADGCSEAPTILCAALDHWGLDEPIQLIGHVYRAELTRSEIATLAQRIALMADDGDPVAAALVDRAAGELARLVAAVARRLGLQRPPLALGGGLFVTSSRLGQGIVAQASLELGPVAYVDDPTRGALVLARRLAHAAGG